MKRMWSVAVAAIIAFGTPVGALADAASVFRSSKSAVVTVRTDRGSGTGFVVGDGSTVLTCNHVVDDAAWIKVDATGASSVSLELQDASRDVGVLRLSRKLRTTLRLNTEAPDPGTKVYVIGTPLGFLKHSITEGIVQGVRSTGALSLLQISTPISPGSSGSPVLDDSGRVVGMAQFHLEQGQGLNFGLTSKDLMSVLSRHRNLVSGIRNQRRSGSTTRTARGKTVVLGKLGQATKTAPIHASPSADSRVFYQAAPLEYLVVRQSEDPEWLQVLLQNGVYGYVRKDQIHQLPYEVSSTKGRFFVKAVTADPDRPRAKTTAKEPTIQSTAGTAVAELALRLQGTPYKESGQSVKDGVGNGEFVQIVFKDWAPNLPCKPSEQALVGQPVLRLEHLRAGDRLYFWILGKDGIDTTGVYLGNGYFVLADPKEGKVAMHYLDEKWRKNLVAARR